MTASGGNGLTVKELLLRVEGKLDSFMVVHEQRHSSEAAADQAARGDPQSSAAGRALSRALSELKNEVSELTKIVASHDRTLQRLIGASALLAALGLGTLGLLVARLAGLIPIEP